jgi:RHS repeat-associated protein
MLMKTLFRVVFCLVFLALSGFGTQAQVVGTPPFGSYSGGPDTLNLANLNSHISIPIFSRPGRDGMNFTYSLTYDSLIWSQFGNWQPASNWGLGVQTQPALGYFAYFAQPIPLCSHDGNPYTEYFIEYYVDTMGVSHSLHQNGPATSDQFCGPTSASATSNDGSGYTATISGFPSLSATIITPQGKLIVPPAQSPAGTGTATDRNGNQITVGTGGIFTDTLGTRALAVSGAAPSPVTYTYTPPSGVNTSVTLTYVSYSVKTAFGCSGVSEYANASVPLPDKVTYPDGSFYQFHYEATPGFPGSVTGRLASLTLPTGGTISYSYTGGSTGHITCADGSTSGLTRTTPDGTWTYARTPGTGAAYTTTITDPSTSANQTVVQFQGIYETQRQTYQGSAAGGTLLQTINTCYNAATSPCTATAIVLPITQRTVLTSLGAPTALTKQCVYKYAAGSGALTEQDDYDYGSGAPGGLLRKTAVTLASLGNITSFQQQIAVTNGAGATTAQTNFNYDETAITATTSTPQHTSVTGSRGNLTSVQSFVGGTTSLRSHTSYYDTGTPNTMTDANGAVTTYLYGTGSCGNSFPTTINEPLSLSQTIAWNCTGGVSTSATDENGKITSAAYTTDAYFWRPNSATDQLGNQTTFYYQPNPSFSSPPEAASILTFNGGSSVADNIQYMDSMGRTYVVQKNQSPGSSTLDSVSYTFDANGRQASVSTPCSVGYTGTCATPKTTQTYDALSRPLLTTDGGGGTVTNSYSANDVLITSGPAPTGENTKRRQLEYDGLGRLTSVCELTAGTTTAPGGSCGQTTAQTGYLTKYTYDANGNILTVKQNAQAATASQQTRTYTYDELSRLAVESNPETGSISYIYDTDTSCGVTSSGDLVKRVDAVGNTSCFAYDTLHRNTSVAYSGTYAANTPNKYFVYDSATVNSIGMSNTKTRLAEAYTATSSTGTKITDVGLSYSARGELTDVYESTPHSGTYYHSSAAFWANGALNQLSGPGLPTFTYGADGEGRANTISASTGTNPVTATTYNVASQPTVVTLGSTDSDAFQYDANTLRPTQYKFNVGTQSVTGNLTWNPNGSLGTLGITDPFNVANTQTCNYSADDISRIGSANCGAIWGQSFAYDAFGNISKSVLSGSAGTSFLPNYQTSPSPTNRIASLPGGFTPTYDANGNSTNDNFHQFTWDAENRPATVVSGGTTVSVTYDAFGHMVEQARGASYTQIVYSPLGSKLTTMTGSTLQKGFVPLTSGASAVYTSAGNSIGNPSFESGFTSWGVSAGATLVNDATRAHSGTGYAQLSSSSAQVVVENQTIPVTPGQQLTFGGWNYLETGTGGPIGTGGYNGWWLAVYDSTGAAITYVSAGGSITASAWTQQSVNYTVPVGAATVMLYSQIDAPTGATVIRSDDGFLVGPGGLAYYRHTDHLGSSRFASTPARTMYSDTAYSAFGEPYAQSGTADPSFTGQDQDTTAGLYDFLYRKYDPGQSRWISPDPLGMGAVDTSLPQSWNRYAYVLNNPLSLLDRLGLDYCQYLDDEGIAVESDDFNSSADECASTGGGYIVTGSPTIGVLTSNPSQTMPQDGNDFGPIDGGFFGGGGDGFGVGVNGDMGGGGNSSKTPWYKTCTAEAIGSGLLHVGIDAIGLLPEGGLLSRALGNYAGYRGIVATQQGTRALQAVKTGTAIGSTGGFSNDTSTTGLVSTGLGVAGVAATLASATPVVGQVISGLSILADVYSTSKDIGKCK